MEEGTDLSIVLRLLDQAVVIRCMTARVSGVGSFMMDKPARRIQLMKCLVTSSWGLKLRSLEFVILMVSKAEER